MSQDAVTGAAANSWGRKTARLLAPLLQAEMRGRRSNEATQHGQRVVIKCAHVGNDKVGVTILMLKRVELVIAAFEDVDGTFDVWTLPASAFINAMKDSRSKNHKSQNAVGQVRQSVFVGEGAHIGTVRLRDAER